MVKVIFCDLDDTLLQPKTKEITYQDQQSIKRWLDSGHLFVLATARHHSFLNNISDKFHEFDFDCIGWNGAEIYMNHKVTK
ncbi:HAD hydrolase family protein, partial [Coprobacillus cateniformis]|nr:HAD hydrolase family protein [Coprobacillus cateniformis]